MTRTPRGPYSAVQDLVSMLRAAFAAWKALVPDAAMVVLRLPTLTIAPRPRSAMAGANAPASR